MTTIAFGEIQVKFPFLPYDIQKNYMSKVIECLETKQNGILESPTGTGKTLSLLCASLAWLEFKKRKINNHENSEMTIPKIIYSSRTHTQIHQAVQEMKRTAYNYMKACVLGSRDVMCINNEVMTETDSSSKVSLCRTKVKRKQCCYHSKVEENRYSQVFCNKNIVDIEDIIDLGKTHDFCPYYMARELELNADIVFMPYNYLLDPKMQKSIGVDAKENIIIFDEAHNIEKVCEESVSIELKATHLQEAVEQIEAIIELLQNQQFEDITFDLNDITVFNTMLRNFSKELNIIPLIQLSLEGTVFDGDYIFEIFNKSGFCESNSSGVLELLDNVLDFLASTQLSKKNTNGLTIFSNLLGIVFQKRGPEFRQKIRECFKFQLQEKEVHQNTFSQSSRTQKCRLLNFWCFCPGFGMQMLLERNIHCVLLTSGTLAPLKPLISELELNFGVQLENPHIVEKNQVCVNILTTGPDMVPLISNFHNRSNPKYMQSLGSVISNLVRIIPDGVLIFFPSYVIMEKTVEIWQGNGTWDIINNIKSVIVEPKNKNSFHNAMNDYYSKIQDPKYRGAIFIGVCRGKISEGLDFTDVNGRAVFIIGLPYPPLKDAKIILKKQYLDFRHNKDKEYMKGDDWYNLEATRAVNQAIGRVIRHKNDYGAIILLDSRFTSPKVKNNMSLWLRHQIIEAKNFSEIIRNLRQFFQRSKSELTPEKKISNQQNLVTIYPSRKILGESPPKRSKSSF